MDGGGPESSRNGSRHINFAGRGGNQADTTPVKSSAPKGAPHGLRRELPTGRIMCQRGDGSSHCVCHAGQVGAFAEIGHTKPREFGLDDMIEGVHCAQAILLLIKQKPLRSGNTGSEREGVQGVLLEGRGRNLRQQ